MNQGPESAASAVRSSFYHLAVLDDKPGEQILKYDIKTLQV